MDSDCLIKISKSGLKELIVKNFNVTIPQGNWQGSDLNII